MGVFSYIFALISLALCANAAFAFLPSAWEIPNYIAAAAAFTGFLIAVVWYFDIKARERAKKKRNKALAAMFVNVVICIAAVAYLIVCMLERLV